MLTPMLMRMLILGIVPIMAMDWGTMAAIGDTMERDLLMLSQMPNLLLMLMLMLMLGTVPMAMVMDMVYGYRGYYGYARPYGYYGRYWGKKKRSADATPDADADADPYYLGYHGLGLGYRAYGYPVTTTRWGGYRGGYYWG